LRLIAYAKISDRLAKVIPTLLRVTFASHKINFGIWAWQRMRQAFWDLAKRLGSFCFLKRQARQEQIYLFQYIMH
jgi:hypothetical protein